MMLLGNGTIITMDEERPLIADGAVLIENGRIKDVGVMPDLKEKYFITSFIDAEGGLIMPGMINTHMHFYSSFARGMPIKGRAPGGFMDILKKLWWRLDKALNYEDIYYSTLVALIEGIRNGTTTYIDHHASPNAVSGSLDEIARACKEAGVRAALSYEVSDRDGEKTAKAGIQENIRFCDSCQDAALLASTFGLHASFTLSDKTLESCVDAASQRGMGFHIHTAEGEVDQKDSWERYGLGVVRRLDSFKIWNPMTLAVHCVHIDDDEMMLLGHRGVNVVHNPESNMGNAVGRARVPAMMKKKLLVGMGTDGYTTDMFESMKVANLVHKHGEKDPGAAWEEVPTMLFKNNGEIASKILTSKIGCIKPGWQADLITIDYCPVTPLQEENFYIHLLMGVNGGMVKTVIVEGKVVMEGREVKGLDTEKIFFQARSLAQELWRRI